MTTLCENCDAPVSGEYCAKCGQAVAGIDIPVGDFARDLASEALGLDSRVRLTILPLFLKPGQVPREFVMGQRARFVPPIRLYLLASFVMFLVLSFSPITVDNVSIDGQPVTIGDLADSVVSQITAATDSTRPQPPEGDTPEGALERADEEPFSDRLEQRFSDGFQRITSDMDAFSRLFMGRMLS